MASCYLEIYFPRGVPFKLPSIFTCVSNNHDNNIGPNIISNWHESNYNIDTTKTKINNKNETFENPKNRAFYAFLCHGFASVRLNVPQRHFQRFPQQIFGFVVFFIGRTQKRTITGHCRYVNLRAT